VFLLPLRSSHEHFQDRRIETPARDPGDVSVANHDYRVADPDLRRPIKLELTVPSENLFNEANHLSRLWRDNPGNHRVPVIWLKMFHDRSLSSLPNFSESTPIPQAVPTDLAFTYLTRSNTNSVVRIVPPTDSAGVRSEIRSPSNLIRRIKSVPTQFCTDEMST
jgi:hypothetical protein